MKTITRIISLLMVALMLTTSVPFIPVSAANDETEEYTLTVENTYTDSSLAESSAVGGMSFFGDTVFDGCYGNQLSGVAREIYDTLVKNYVTDKKTGEYTHTFETPFTFDVEISGGSIVMNDELEEVDLEIGYAMQAAMDAFLYDHPEVFWLRIIGSSYGVSASGNDVSGYTGIIDDITIIPTEIYSGASSKLSQYESAVDSVIDAITVTESRYETLKNIHNYICNNAWYNLVSEQRVHSSEPFFIGDGGVVCEGYAKTFKILCDRLEIPCVLVSGDAGGAHMWNYVQMDDGKWYLVDVTWDDQESKIYDTYFLTGAYMIGFNDVAICEERTERTDFSGTGIFSFTYPVLSDTTYTVHIHEWDSDYTVDVEPTCTENGSKSIHCLGCNETKSVTEMPATDIHNYENYVCSYCGGFDKANLISYGQCGEKVYYTLDNSGNMRIYGSGDMYDYDTDESAPWNTNKNQIKKAIIENGVTSIGEYAFYFSKLQSIEIADSVICICDHAFSGSDLTSIIIPDSIESIGYFSFSFCRELTSITIPDSVTSIDYTAFVSCSSLESIIVDKNNPVFYSIDNVLFNSQESKLVLYPAGSTRTTYTIPENIVCIGSYSFSYCSNLTNVEIPDSVTSIDSFAFDGCTNLTSITIPNSVISIGGFAFCECTSLTSITIPNSMIKIGSSAFSNCESLKTVHYFGTISNWYKMSIGSYNSRLIYAERHYCTELEKIKETCVTDGFETGWYCNDCEIYIEGGVILNKLGHSFDTEYTVDLAPTCTSKGSKSQHCLREGCNYQINVTAIPAIINHENKKEYGEQNPTCIEKGYTAGIYCPDCKEWLEGHEEISALEHNWDNGTIISLSTCKTHGEKIYTCLNDTSHTKVEQIALDGSNHEGGTYFKNKSDATCTEIGYTGDLCCIGCDEIITKGNTLQMLSHNVIDGKCSLCGVFVVKRGEVMTLSFTTTSYDEVEWVCGNNIKILSTGKSSITSGSYSRNTFSVKFEAITPGKTYIKAQHNGSLITYADIIVECIHEFTNYISNDDATCIDGTKTAKCDFCDETNTVIDHGSARHVFNMYISDNNATCTQDGTKTAICDACNIAKDVIVDEGSSYGHSWNEGVITAKSTCKTHGIKTYTCQNDASHTKTDKVALDASNHEGGTYLKDKTDVTCTVNGYTGDTYCSGCNVKLSTGEIIPATNHPNGEITEQVDATCTSMGYTVGTYCPNCKEWLEGHEEIPELPHDYDSVVIVPTCTAKGYTTHTCTVCGESYTDTYVNAIGHTGGSATCKNKAKCTVCNKEYGSLNANNHKALVTLKAVASTCSKTGLSEGKKCVDCGKVTLAQKTVAKKAHTYKTTATKATLSKNGKSETKCTTCGYVSKTTAIYAPKTVNLSAASYTYNGKVKTPSVTVKDSKGKKLKNGTDYTVKYSKGRKSIGKYTVTVTFKGNYSGTKKLTFEIVPAKVTLSKLTAGSKALTATWKTVSGATGYEVQYSTSKKFTSKTTKTVKIKSSKTKKTTIKKLTKGKKYYVRIRAYKTVNKKPVYGAWSSVKSIKVK